jgi:hypothetical protein
VAPNPAAFPTRWVGAVPGRYWNERYLDALAMAELSRDPELRNIYLELADHYLAMMSLVGESDNIGNGDDDRSPDRKRP